jgi:hypothetical protein
MGNVGSGVIRSVFRRADEMTSIAIRQHGSVRPRLFFYSGVNMNTTRLPKPFL